MKAHKYWSLGSLLCMTGSFYTGYRKFMKAHKYFSFMHTVLYDHGYLVRSQNDHSLKKIAGKRIVLLTTNNCKYEIKIDRT